MLLNKALDAKLDLEYNIHRMDTLLATSSGPNSGTEADQIALALVELPTIVKSNIRDIIKLLSNKLLSTKVPFDRSTTQRYLEEATNAKTRAEAALDLLDKDKIKLQNQRQTLTTAIDALSAGGIEEIGDDIILTLEKVTSLGLA
ncbi:alpha-xenorhabdolysin family binary toxin subunit B, partial [Rhizobium sp. SIMBA_035]